MRAQDKEGVDMYPAETKPHGLESPQTGFPEKNEERHQRRVASTPGPRAGHKSIHGLFNIHVACAPQQLRAQHKVMALGHGQDILNKLDLNY